VIGTDSTRSWTDADTRLPSAIAMMSLTRGNIRLAQPRDEEGRLGA
jgi:hypothetical protein